MYPKSWLGQIIGILCAICGLLMLTLPVSVVATNFSVYHSYAKAYDSLPAKKMVKVAVDANRFFGPYPVQDPEYNSSELGTTVSPMNNELNSVKEKIIKYDSEEKLEEPCECDALTCENAHDVSVKMTGKRDFKPKKMSVEQLVMILHSEDAWKFPQ